ncbi:hypothetical protein RRG08_019225 [Elysia crispata]|uniref:Uncharacterized protein n=1 Tax=Elysia crispata TaxID=231223 RepID=A0AAE1E4E2_9GAST|nr:hypothetical protein RRG08_019225 [Elysia crispata]
MVDTFNIPAILVGSLLGLLICVLVGTVVYNVCKRRKMFGDDKEPARPKVFPETNEIEFCVDPVYFLIRREDLFNQSGLTDF